MDKGKDCLVKRIFEAAAGGLLLATALLVLAFSTLRDALYAVRSARFCKLDPSNRPAPVFADSIPGKFCFDRAIPAYEALIDAVAAEKRI